MNKDDMQRFLLSLQRDAQYAISPERNAKRLEELRQRRAMLMADLENMRHFPPAVQARMQAQIDTVDAQIATAEKFAQGQRDTEQDENTG